MKLSFSIGRDRKPQAVGLRPGQTQGNLVWASLASPRSGASRTLAPRLGFRCNTVATPLQHRCNTVATPLQPASATLAPRSGRGVHAASPSVWSAAFVQLQSWGHPAWKRPEGRAPLSTRQNQGFTLVEILVTMTLLSFIVLGLLMMFNQTQRAFRAGLAQTDVLEGGRNAMDLLVRDLEQMTPCGQGDRGLTSNPYHMVNFWTALDPRFDSAGPQLQYLAPNAPQRANVVQQFFLLTKYNQDWTANYYRVEPDAPKSMVGSLYCYSVTNCPRYAPLSLGSLFYAYPSDFPPPQQLGGYWISTNRIVDGVIHLHLTVFDTNGVPLTFSPNNPKFTLAASVNPARPSLVNASATRWSFATGTQPSQMDYAFWSNAVPAYVELELGILEPKVLQHYRAIDPSTAAAANYLSNHVGQVHLFRQRIPIRNVDFSAYQ